MTLLDELRSMIALEGPIPVDRYMALCLGHPVHGYYMTRDPLGAGGDFITAPEISQMFGEMIGLWAVSVWERLGAPRPVRLVELGPGRGTLMTDLLRAARVRPGFIDALTVELVETSPVLKRVQAERLRSAPSPARWHARLEDVPAGPAIVLANEFFDALPVRQLVLTGQGWRERLVGLGPDGGLAFGLSIDPVAPPAPDAEAGSVIERSPAGLALAKTLAERLAREGGAALVVDYGYDGPAQGDTLQAVRGHAFVDPLRCPGEADLTAHVDFGALQAAVRAGGATPFGPIGQGQFLRALGIETRAERLKARATPTQADAIDSALDRLTGSSPRQMGRLFQAFGFAEPRFDALPGLSTPGAVQLQEANNDH